ncbi:DUF3558 domain-containing protein [Nocardia veterana]|uniref:DUF3558 domain-containing protein n=1 Tax=Nocardia veterana TaxID=132249 RepID=A0A7X6LW81_9NOCA|nr:DUF3558 domain-containing protein [Nocardia veterana]NKY85047.1 DUF3558 domain-containing protein [Nocardia veterana]
MRICSALIAATALALALSACSSDKSDGDSPATRPPVKVAALGPFVGECGHVSDDEVRTIGGLPQISRAFKNSVGCNWQAAGIGGPSVTFASYRGSPIERERAWVTAQGRSPETIEVAGKKGFQAVDPTFGICDLAVQLGDDFFEWSTAPGAFDQPSATPCDKNRKLAELTVQRLK